MRCRFIRKIFQNEENGYTIAVFSTQDTSVPLSARDKFWSAKKVIAFTAIGYDLPLSDEIEVEMRETGNPVLMDFNIRWKAFWKLCQEPGRVS